MVKVQKVLSQPAQISNRLIKLKSDLLLSAVTGDYKGYKAAKKQYAEIASSNFDQALKTSNVKPVSVPLFSKIGMRILKVCLLGKFRIKTSAEKELARLSKIESAKKKLNIHT